MCDETAKTAEAISGDVNFITTSWKRIWLSDGTHTWEAARGDWSDWTTHFHTIDRAPLASDSNQKYAFPQTEDQAYRLAHPTNPYAVVWKARADDLKELLSAARIENDRLTRERDAFAAELEALRPKPEPKPRENPFARRHDGRAPDMRQDEES